MAAEPARRRFTVAEYYQMGAAGVLTEDDRTELIDGEIIAMSPIGHRHAACVKRNNDQLSNATRGRAIVSVQDPLRLGDYQEPVPDLMLLRPRADFYASGHPAAADVLLLIEVSDSTFTYDQRTKLPVYARFEVPEVWIEDLSQERILMYREPTPDGYRSVTTRRRGDRLSPALLPDVDLAVDDLLT